MNDDNDPLELPGMAGGAAAEVQEPDGIEDDAFDDDLEFRPVQRTKAYWVTWVLVLVLVWGLGFVVGVLVDRSVAGLMG